MSNASFEPAATNSGVRVAGHKGALGKRVLHTVLLVFLVVACLGGAFLSAGCYSGQGSG